MISSFFILLLLMLGSGAFHPAAVGYAGSLSPLRRGRNILLFTSGGALGLGISQIVFIKTLNQCNGNVLVLLIPVFLLIVWIFLYPIEEQTENKKLSLKEFVQPILREKRHLIFLYLTQVFNYTLVIAFIFLLPDLMKVKGCHPWLCMGGGHLCFILGGALMMVPIGYLSDRFNPKSILFFFSFFLFYTFLSRGKLSLWETILYVTCLGGGMSPVTPILVSWANKILPESPSTVSALLMGCAWCFSSLGATWAGLISKTINVDPIETTLFFLGFLLVLGFLLIFFMPQRGLAKSPHKTISLDA